MKFFHSRKMDELASAVEAQRAELFTLRLCNIELQERVIEREELITLHEQYDRLRDEDKKCGREQLAYKLASAFSLMGLIGPGDLSPGQIQTALEIVESEKATSLGELSITDLPTRRDD